MMTVKEEFETVSDITYYKGAYFTFFMFFFVSSIASGLSHGSTLFAMEDVNLLFVSPVHPRRILLYGILRAAKTATLFSLFILFQGIFLRRFGVGIGGMAVLYMGYLLAVVTSRLLSLTIYSVTNGRKKGRWLRE